MPQQRLKVKFSKLPFTVENRLVTKHGFTVFSRDNVENWVILVKNVDKKIAPVDDNPANLSEVVQTDLLRVCNRVVDIYEHPELHIKNIMARLTNLGCTYGPAERAFIKRWADKWVMNAAVIEDDQEVIIIH